MILYKVFTNYELLIMKVPETVHMNRYIAFRTIVGGPIITRTLIFCAQFASPSIGFIVFFDAVSNIVVPYIRDWIPEHFQLLGLGRRQRHLPGNSMRMLPMIFYECFC